uniref:Uncharacterized protein n=1 Tax=Fagus sylvatica TaxID=28930 RepID=A0A2N9I2U3_FAGSY
MREVEGCGATWVALQRWGNQKSREGCCHSSRRWRCELVSAVSSLGRLGMDLCDSDLRRGAPGQLVILLMG